MSEHTILLVNDDPEIVKTVKRYLQHEDYAVLAAQQRSPRAISCWVILYRSNNSFKTWRS